MKLRLIVIGVVVIVFLLVVGGGAEIVDTGHRGVKTTFGKVVSDSLPEGLYFYNPLTSTIVELDTRLQRWDADTQAYTKDVQQASVKIALNYRLHQDRAHSMYAEVGRDWADRLVPQVVFGAIKNEFGRWNAVDIIGNRADVQQAIEKAVRATLSGKYVDIERFEIQNIDYDEAFERAVEQKVIAQQDAIREQNRTQQIEEQARQKVLQAEAEAKSIEIRAQALEANAKLVEWEAVQRWDGKLPTYMFGGNSGAVPFLPIPTK
jgi:regulator of protease activity HflC (stomatin/prohibitin superfamily)